MKGYLNSDKGRIMIAPDVIAKYAGTAAVECFGVVGMAMISMKDGLVKLLKRESITKGVEVTILTFILLLCMASALPRLLTI